MRVVILTVVLAAVLGVDARQAKGNPRSVCTGKGDGDFVNDDTSCSGFFVCYNGEPVSQDCGAGSYFDTEQNYCLPDTKNICSKSECNNEGAFSEYPSDCSKFYVCYGGKLVEQSCGAGSYFDETDLYCLPDTENKCPQPECNAEGAFSEYPNDCSKFYVCYGGKLVEQSCGAGSYFDKTDLYCLPDTENKCPQPECNAEGAFSEYPNDCSKFYICYDGKLVEQSCGAGSYFDKTNLFCLPDTENVCPTPKCTVEGAFSAHPTNCSQFYVCYQGELVEQSCGEGSYFDSTNLYCLPDTGNNCSQSKCSVEGAFSPHPTECALFYVCYNGALVEQTCGNGSYFDKTDLYCLPDTNNTCWSTTTTPEPCTCVGGYTEGEFVASPDSCYSYYVCSAGELVEQNCGYGNYFDNSSKRCERDSTGQCWPVANTTSPSTTVRPCTCPGGYEEGDFVASSENCYAYYVCSQGELVEQNCGFGNYFNNDSKTCEKDTNGECWPTSVTDSTTTTVSAGCPCPGGYQEGDLIGNSDSCSSYFVCTQGELVAQSCGTGNYFNSINKTCERDENGICWPTTTTPAPCKCPGGYEEGDLVGNSDSCSSYFVCTQGELVAQSCGTGNYFNSINKTCERDENGICWPTTTTPAPCKCPGGYEEGDLVGNSASCSSYFVCTQGELVAQSCGTGNYFNSINKTCERDENGICWPTTTTPAPCICPGGYEEGDLVANSDNCSSYFICTQGELVAQSCGTGNYFNSINKTCERDENGICWPTTTTPAPCKCPGGYEEGDLVGNSDSCSSYFVCTQGELVAQSCGTGNYFNSINKTCERDENGICWPTTTTPAPCKCPGGYVEGDLVGNSDSCSSYFVCTQGELVAQSCGTGNYFNSINKTCERDENGICWPTTTTPAPCKCPGGYEEGDLVGNSDSCSSYFVCTQGELVAQSCGTGNYFNSINKTCERDENGICWPTTTTPAPCKCPGGYEEGDLVGNSDSCSSYFVCTQGELVAQSCGTGNYFNSINKTCERDENGICWPTTTTLVPCKCPGGYEEGDLVANSDSCSSYFVCTQGELVAQSCGTGNYFNNNSKTCERDENGICWLTTSSSSTTGEPCTCEGGYDQGSLVPHPESCYLFYVCFNGELVEESCGVGNYFDNGSKSCVQDTTGVCWQTSTSSSSTTTPSTTKVSTTTPSTTKSTSTTQSTTKSTTTPSTTTPSTTKSSTTSTTPVPCTCPGGYEDGELVAYPGNCSLFYICYQGELIEGSCGYGNYFNATSKNCILDSAGVCWQTSTSTSTTTKSTTTPSTTTSSTTTPSTTTPSTTTPSTTTPSTTTPSTTTPSTTTPSTTTSSTTKSSTTSTTSVPCTCPGGYEDGELVAYPGNCSLFYICYQGELIEGSCGYGNYFNATSKNCVLDSAGVCWQTSTSTSTTTKSTTTPSTTTPSTTTPSTTTPSTTTPSTTTPSTTTSSTTNSSTTSTTPVPCTCPGGYEDGELVAYPGNCSLFYICYQGELIEGSCGYGNYFNATSKNCILDSAGVCWQTSTSTSTTTKSTTTPSTTTSSTTTPSTTTPSTTTPSTTTPSTTTPSTTTPSTTTPSTTTSSTTKSSTTSTTPVPCTCPGGYEDGELVAYPGNCSLFYICYQGELIEGSCGYGNYFNATSKNCVLDSAGVCWQTSTSTSTTTKSTTTPSTTTPSTTTPSTTTPSTTTPSTTTSSTTKSSTTSTTPVPCTCPGGYEDGDLVAYPGNCSMFYICYQGELIEGSCGYGNYFNATSKNCVLDSAGVCWQTSTSTSTTTKSTTTPSTTTPSTTTPSTKTPSTTTPSSTTSSTTKSSTTSTTPVPCTCPGGYEDGELVAYPGNCSLFYICYQGELIEGSCGYGNYFNATSKNCILDSAGVCWQTSTSTSTTTKSTTTPSTTTPSTTTPSTKTPSTTTPSSTTSSTTKSSTTSTTPVPCTCPGGYEDGELVAYPGNCSLFYICYQGELIEGSCGYGNYFNATSKNCVLDSAGVCWQTSTSTSTTTKSTTTPSTTTSSTTTPSTTTPSTTTPSTTTPSTTTPSTTTPSTTTPSTTTSSTTKSSTTSTTPVPCTCPGGYEDGELVAYPGNCSLFYICYQGELIEGSCGYGNYFNSTSKSCVLDSAGVCWQTSTSTSTTTKSTTTPSTTTPSTTTPSTTTPSTTTSSTTKSSTTSTTPVPCTCPGGYEDGELVAYPGNCSLFYICYQGELIEGSCGYGNYFNSTSKSCVLDSAGVCWQTSTSTSTTTKSTTTPSTTTPSTTTPSTTTPSTTTPSTTTPSTTTSSKTKSSTTSTTPVPCTCPGGYEDGELVAYPGNCSLFYICYQGELIEGSCGYGNYFNSTSKSCVLDSAGVCWQTSTSTSTTTKSTTTPSTTTPSTTTPSTTTPSTTTPSTTTPSTTTPSTTTPSTTTPSTTTPSTTTPSTTTSSTTKSSTTSTTPVPCTCPGGYEDGELVAYPGNCSLFYICYQGELIEGSCGYGNYFNSTSKSCVLDSAGVCWQTSTSTSTTTKSTTTPSTTTPSTTTPSTTTPSTTTSSTTKSSTTSTTPVPCTCPGGYEDGELVAYPGNCSLFYICYQGELIEGSCGYGNYFNSTSKSCVLDSAGVCWQTSTSTSTTTKSTTTPSTTTPSTTTPSTTTPSTTTPSTTTPSTTTPSTTASTTDSTTTKSSTTSTTQVPCTCPGGYEDGELVKHPDSCYLFYICYQGVLVDESCGYGNYFEPESKTCVLDTTGVCWKTSTSSSTTTKSTTTPSTTTPSTTLSTSTASTTTPSTTTSSTTTPSTTTPSTTTPSTTTSSTTKSSTTSTTQVPCTCPGGYKDGDFVQHPDSCYLFYICYQGVLVVESCGYGNYFDDVNKNCALDTTGMCWKTSTSSSTTTKSTTTSSTTSTSTTTTAPTDVPAPCQCANGLQEGQFAENPSSCYLYFICSGGELVEGHCGTGNYFNNDTKLCEPDVGGCCWPVKPLPPSPPSPSPPNPTPCECPNGLKDGEFSENPSSCYLYYICSGGELVEGHCGTGNYFNNDTKLCEPDVGGCCWPVKPLPPSPPSPSPPNPTPCECPNGLKDGEFSENPSSCYLYYICSGGELVEGNCGTYNYFNNDTKLCEPDVGGCCWPAKPLPPSPPSPPSPNPPNPTPCECSNGLKEGEFSENPSSCYLYYICSGGELVEGHCGTGNYFNNDTKICEPDVGGCCWPVKPLPPSPPSPPSPNPPNPTPCECSNGLKEGEFSENPSSCYLYYICSGGKLVEGNCGTGNYFNNDTKICEPDVGGCCWPVKPLPPSPPSPPSPNPPNPTPCECSNGLKEGEFSENPSSCYLYYICSGGKLVEGNCGTGNYFNNDTKICEPDVGGCCWPVKPPPVTTCPGGYANGEFVPDHNQCDKFYICDGGKLVPQFCGVGYVFDIDNNYCTRDVKGTCWAVQTPGNTCEGASEGTYLQNNAACDKFFVCYKNEKILQECGVGNVFNPATLSCSRDNLGTCWKQVPNVCANLTTGTFVQNPYNCQEFYVCLQNRAVLQQCGNGNWFNPSLSICQPDLNAVCINVCQGTNSTMQLSHPNCNRFYKCQKGRTTGVGTCPSGMNFDATLGICQAGGICEANLCSTSANGVVFAVQNDLTSFYSCYNQIPLKLTCPSGTSFDSERLICTPDTGRCVGRKNGFTVASYHNPNAYYVCRDNMAIFEQCPSYAIFDEKKGVCVHAQRKRLSNNICATEPDGTMLQGDACNKFHLCLDGDVIDQNCGAYSSFSVKLGYCVFNLSCFDQNEICARASDIEKFPDARRETSFLKCDRGLAVLEKCPNNMVYSHDIGYCVPKELTMTEDELEALCEEAADNTMAPALDCRKFYICRKNMAILQQCSIDQHFDVKTGTCLPDVERQCWLRSETLRRSFFLKSVCYEDQIRAHPTDCARFERCTYGIWTREACPEGEIFDAERNACIPANAEALCPAARSGATPECVNEEALRASDELCTDYYRCENSQWQRKRCPLGEFFSGSLGTCTRDASACARSVEVVSTKGNRCISNETLASAVKCNLFHVCYEGEWWYRHCEEGTYFNKSLEACIPNDGTCRLAPETGPCKNGTVQTSDYDPCRTYHLCVDGNWTTQYCPAGHHFNESRKACMLDEFEGPCQVDFASSPCVDGERRYQPSNCAAFKICSFGKWLSVQCSAGTFFDTGLSLCIPNRGDCSADGLLRRNCIENSSRRSQYNCSEFFFCSKNKWHLENCLRGFHYNATLDKCIQTTEECPARDVSSLTQTRCVGVRTGTYISHAGNCTKYYLCADDLTIEAECAFGRFYDDKSKSCQLNDGSCPVESMSEDSLCEGKVNGSHVQNPADCTTFFICTDTLVMLTYCPPGQYFNADIGACQIDTGICSKPRLCDNSSASALAHERYCNIYYSCVRGIAIPVACEDGELFNSTSAKCTPDLEQRCVDGLWVGDEICAEVEDGAPQVDRSNCTQYIICSKGRAQTLECPQGQFFNSSLMQCMPDDGSCRNVSISCVGKHGDLMPDPKHCNEFYACIYGSLQHDRCFDREFFDLSTHACTPMAAGETCPTAVEMSTLCIGVDEETNFADQTDCRKYYQCNDGAIESKKCRTGESFDTLLGFCRQNDGTCLLENGQRVGACAGKHGKLTADKENCRGYFTCINGQKISDECDDEEYFDKVANVCRKDLNNTCRPQEDDLTNTTQLSCNGLIELVFYPNVLDGCRTFFQCVKGIPRVHKCPDDLLFNGASGICDWKDYVKCIDMTDHHQNGTICLNTNNGTRYASTEDNCDSYYICTDGKLSNFKCDIGLKYNEQLEKCDLAANVNCTMTAPQH